MPKSCGNPVYSMGTEHGTTCECVSTYSPSRHTFITMQRGKARVIPAVIPRLYTKFSTAFFHAVHLLYSQFSPLSPVPITTKDLKKGNN